MNPRLILSAARVSLSVEGLQKLKGDFEEQISGGRAEGKCVEDFDFFALLKGVLVELEHTDDPMLALEITMDHLSESPEYYDYLEKMESQMETDGAMGESGEESEEESEESDKEEVEEEIEEEELTEDIDKDIEEEDIEWEEETAAA